MTPFSGIEDLNVKFEISELVWHLVFCCISLSLEPSKKTLKN